MVCTLSSTSHFATAKVITESSVNFVHGVNKSNSIDFVFANSYTEPIISPASAPNIFTSIFPIINQYSNMHLDHHQRLYQYHHHYIPFHLEHMNRRIFHTLVVHIHIRHRHRDTQSFGDLVLTLLHS